MIVLSHRGFWLSPSERNTDTAFKRSFQQGFGTETDVRDSAGKLVVSHDPPSGAEFAFGDFLNTHGAYGGRLPLAINIKADGLQRLLTEALECYQPLDCFVFDMSIPDTNAWLRTGIPVFVRHSDIEREPCFYEAAAGIWLDGLETDWVTEKDILAHLCAGKRVCIVSPELHGRDPGPLWSRLSAAECRWSDNLMICTDRPVEALAMFGEN